MTDSNQPLELRARYVIPVSGPPLAGGAITIVGQRIVSVSRAVSTQAVDLGDVAILPGLVNAHVHLEFSALESPLGQPGMEFTAWIRQVIAHRRQVEPAAAALPAAALPTGAAECIRTGSTALGEISTRQHFSDVDLPPLELTDFAEVICLDRGRIPEIVAAARSRLTAAGASDRYRLGISPHAPYTVHVELLDELVSLAAENGAPLAMHLAESPAELELLATGGGAFRALLEDLEVWRPDAIPASARPLDYLRRLARAPRSLVIHGNYLDREAIALLARQRERMAVVYCPRTHAFFDHPPHPLPELWQAGARVALGTDGRSSNPDLSLLAELRFAARRFTGLPPERFVRMATLDGAAALGVDQQTGSITAGKFADLACVAVESRSEMDPHEALLSGDKPVLGTMSRGRWTWLDASLRERLPAWRQT